MQHRWSDVNQDIDHEDENDFAEYVGGVGDADLWFVRGNDVLICQYEDEDTYVSYHPASVVIEHALGVIDYENTPSLDGHSIKHPENVKKHLLWHGKDVSMEVHQPEMVARYLAIFAPYVFSEAERIKALGQDLTKQGEMK